MSMWTPFAYISQLFHLMWVYSKGLFSPKWRVDSQPSDIEAGILATPAVPVEQTAVVFYQKKGFDNATALVESLPNPFIDRHVSISQKTSKNIPPSEDQVSNLPLRRPSRRLSTIVPFRSRIVDATAKKMQDNTIDVIKSVIVTCGPVVAVACSARIEYFEDHVTSPAEVKYFDSALHQPTYAQVEYFDDDISSVAKVEYFNWSEVTEPHMSVQEESFATCDSRGSDVVQAGSDDVEYICGPISEPMALDEADLDSDRTPTDSVARFVDVFFSPLSNTQNTADGFVPSPRDSVPGRVPIQGGLKYSHRRYSTCDTLVNETRSDTPDSVTGTFPNQNRARIQDGINYSHRRYSTCNSLFNENSTSSTDSYSACRTDTSTDTASTHTSPSFSGSPDTSMHSAFVLDGNDFVEDSAEWSYECVGAMEAVADFVLPEESPSLEHASICHSEVIGSGSGSDVVCTPTSTESGGSEATAEAAQSLRKNFRNSLEHVEFLKEQLDASFEAAYKKAGIPWIPTGELNKNLERESDSRDPPLTEDVAPAAYSQGVPCCEDSKTMTTTICEKYEAVVESEADLEFCELRPQCSVVTPPAGSRTERLGSLKNIDGLALEIMAALDLPTDECLQGDRRLR